MSFKSEHVRVKLEVMIFAQRHIWTLDIFGHVRFEPEQVNFEAGQVRWEYKRMIFEAEHAWKL